MKTSQSIPIGKAEHPVSLKIIFNFFTNSSRESEGSLSTWSFGSSGYDGCLSVAQKDSPKKCLLGQRESNWRIFPTIMVYCHLFISPLSNCLLYADSTTNLFRVYYLFSLKLVISCFTYKHIECKQLFLNTFIVHIHLLYIVFDSKITLFPHPQPYLSSLSPLSWALVLCSWAGQLEATRATKSQLLRLAHLSATR